MLRHISVRDFAIIDQVEVSLDRGMTALTGETGAGKSILIDVIGLILGDRADATSVRDGAAQADLSAEFELAPEHPASVWLVAQDLLDAADIATPNGTTTPTALTVPTECAPPKVFIPAKERTPPNQRTASKGRQPSREPSLPKELAGAAAFTSSAGSNTATVSLLVRRVITAAGKNRAWINGRPATIGQLKTLGEWLVDIHGQHAHQQLLRRTAQRELLDSFIDPSLSRAVAHAYSAWQKSQAHLAALRERLAQAQDRMELLRFQTAELQDWAPQTGEFSQISAEQNQLAHAHEVLAAIQSAYQALSEDAGLTSGLDHLLAGLHEVARHEQRLGSVIELFDAARIQLQEGADEMRRLADRIELDPERLTQLDERMTGYLRLARKHRVEPDALAEFLQQLTTELADLDASDQASADLERQVQEDQRRYAAAAQALSAARVKAAGRLDAAVTAAMQELGMRGGRFQLDLQPMAAEPGPQGQDRIEFMVAANPGIAAQPLARVASGGELSRIGLALQVLASAEQPVDTLIFDEVDSGISGAVAEVVGGKLRALGERYQVLCVTHLPQVAAQAHHHLLVQKHAEETSTRTEITLLSENARVRAIASMLGGVEITEPSLAHAATLLAQAARRD